MSGSRLKKKRADGRCIQIVVQGGRETLFLRNIIKIDVANLVSSLYRQQFRGSNVYIGGNK